MSVAGFINVLSKAGFFVSVEVRGHVLVTVFCKMARFGIKEGVVGIVEYGDDETVEAELTDGFTKLKVRKWKGTGSRADEDIYDVPKPLSVTVFPASDILKADDMVGVTFVFEGGMCDGKL